MNWRNLKTKKLGQHWWIVGDEEDGPYGPYDTKTEADGDRIGITKFMTTQNDPSFLGDWS